MNTWILSGIAFKATAVLAAAWLVSIALRRASAAARHLVWTAAAAAVLALPALSIGLPTWRIAAVDRMLAADTGLTFRVNSTDAGRTPSTDAAPQQAAAAQTPRRGIDWLAGLPYVWGAGTAAMLLQMIAAYASLSRKRRRARALQLPASVPVLEAEPGSMPMAFGVAHPVVFLPADASSWSADRLRIVLMHEIAHITRGDLATHLVARTALALHWWNPLAWYSWREFLRERERAADDLVLHSGARASEYAQHLLEVAQSFHSGPATAWAAVAMARQSQLEGRLVSILDGGVRRGAVRKFAPLAAGIAAVALVAPFAALNAQEKTLPPDVDATIRAASAQKNHEILDQAANAFINLQKYDVAQALLENSLRIRQEVAGDHSGTYAAGLVKLGELFARRGQSKEADDFFNRAVDLGDRPEIAPALIHQALNSFNHPIIAQGLLERAVTLDPNGKSAGPALTWLAVIEAMPSGSAAEAERLFQRALAVEEPDATATATTLELYARFLKTQGREPEAEPFLARARSIRGVQAVAPQSTTAPSSSMQAAMRVGNGVSAPRLVRKVEPEYSEEARAAKFEGTVLLYVEIAPDGKAHNARVLRSAGMGLDEKAIQAVQQWDFAPGMKDDAPVTVQAQIEVNFHFK